MKPNKYTERRKEARRLYNLLYGRDGRNFRQQVQLKKPWWTGDYTFEWLPNEKHRSFKDFDVAMSLREYLPKPIVYKRYAEEIVKRGYPKDLVYYQIQHNKKLISQLEYDSLTPQQRKFFSGNQEGWTWIDDYRHHPIRPILDRHGNRLYRFNMDVQQYFVPRLVKYKVNKVWIRSIEEPDYRKWEEKYWNTGFARKYFIQEHHSNRYKHVDLKGRKKFEEKELLAQIEEGLEEWESEKNAEE